ncbi:MAG: FAD-dependent oxidoreductase [Pseudonocardiales bacterium]|nr:FAD-dependent oxidoreductase [Pseudonocardiales bacterium]
MESVEVVVLGAGVMGAATAWRLAGRGREVALIERFRIGHHQGSSHGPTRVFRYSYADPLHVRMARRVLPMWRELEDEAGQSLLDLCGGIDIGPRAALEPLARALGEGGAQIDWVERVADRFPGVRTDGPALFSPHTGAIAAAASVRAMVRLAAERNVRVVEETPARIERADDSGVMLDVGGERLSACRCVLAVGAWTGELATSHVPWIPLGVTREQIVYVEQRADFPVVIDRSTAPCFRYAIPQRFGAPGVRAGQHGTGPGVLPDEPRRDDQATVSRVIDFIAESIPAAGTEPAALETCLYTNTPDHDFVLDQVGPLVVASPCSGHGFKFAPLVGEICAQLALGEDPEMDLSRFSLTRFQPATMMPPHRRA